MGTKRRIKQKKTSNVDPLTLLVSRYIQREAAKKECPWFDFFLVDLGEMSDCLQWLGKESLSKEQQVNKLLGRVTQLIGIQLFLYWEQEDGRVLSIKSALWHVLDETAVLHTDGSKYSHAIEITAGRGLNSAHLAEDLEDLALRIESDDFDKAAMTQLTNEHLSWLAAQIYSKGKQPTPEGKSPRNSVAPIRPPVI